VLKRQRGSEEGEPGGKEIPGPGSLHCLCASTKQGQADPSAPICEQTVPSLEQPDANKKEGAGSKNGT